MSAGSRQHLYLRLIQEECNAFDRAKRKSENAGPNQRGALSRDWFAASARLLKEHLRSIQVQNEGSLQHPYPGDAVLRLANLAETLATGHVPQVVKDINVAGGHPERWPGERRDIATALQYIAYTKEKMIADRRFIMTVTEAFSVDRTTVYGWQKKQDELMSGARKIPVDKFPEALNKAGARYHFNRKGERTEGVD